MSRHHVLEVLSLVFVAACTGEETSGYEAAEAPENAASEPAKYTPCEEGRSEPCTQVIGVHGSVTSCFRGVMTCVSGRWTACGPAPDGGAPSTDEMQ